MVAPLVDKMWVSFASLTVALFAELVTTGEPLRLAKRKS